MNPELGEITYKPLGPDAVPLSRATVWPETLPDKSAQWYAALLEHKGSKAIGAELCPASHLGSMHSFWAKHTSRGCPGCGAIV